MDELTVAEEQALPTSLTVSVAVASACTVGHSHAHMSVYVRLCVAGCWT